MRWCAVTSLAQVMPWRQTGAKLMPKLMLSVN